MFIWPILTLLALSSSSSAQQGNWDTAIGAGTFVSFGGAAIGVDNGNIGVNAGEGVYYMDVNLSEGTITATKVETMGMIGGFNNWDGDAKHDMEC